VAVNVTHHYLAQRLRISGAILLLPLCAVIVVNRDKFTFMGLFCSIWSSQGRHSAQFLDYF